MPAYLRLCAPWLEPDEVRMLQREDPQAWTASDLPLLDAARLRLGDPEASRRRRRHDAPWPPRRERWTVVVDDILELDDEDGMLRPAAPATACATPWSTRALPEADPDLLAGPFAHIVVDEAQELTDAEWQMLLLRCPSRSFTIVGDRAQARHGFTESWQDRLERVGLDRIHLAPSSINYRTPVEVMEEAEQVIRAVLPDANVPTSIRSGGVPVVHGSISELGSILDTWLAAHAEGTACVIGDPSFTATSRVRSLTPVLSKGLEFDLVVLVDPETFGEGIEGGGGPLRRDDPRDPAAGDPDQHLSTAESVEEPRLGRAVGRVDTVEEAADRLARVDPLDGRAEEPGHGADLQLGPVGRRRDGVGGDHLGDHRVAAEPLDRLADEQPVRTGDRGRRAAALGRAGRGARGSSRRWRSRRRG